MDLFTVLLFAAFGAVVISLGGGILSMINGGEIGHKDGVQWMTMRVGFQAVAFVLLLLALLVKG